MMLMGERPPEEFSRPDIAVILFDSMKGQK
jgi:ATP sulfurylase